MLEDYDPSVTHLLSSRDQIARTVKFICGMASADYMYVFDILFNSALIKY